MKKPNLTPQRRLLLCMPYLQQLKVLWQSESHQRHRHPILNCHRQQLPNTLLLMVKPAHHQPKRSF
jgi:hypothetical protein